LCQPLPEKGDISLLEFLYNKLPDIKGKVSLCT
jgi:hypothetical protein